MLCRLLLDMSEGVRRKGGGLGRWVSQTLRRLARLKAPRGNIITAYRDALSQMRGLALYLGMIRQGRLVVVRLGAARRDRWQER